MGEATPCDGWAVIRPTHADIGAMSEGLKRQILTHDKHGHDVCGWAE